MHGNNIPVPLFKFYGGILLSFHHKEKFNQKLGKENANTEN